MEALVVTLETAKKLKAAGFCNDFGTKFIWCEVEKKTSGEIESYVYPGHYGHSAVSWRTLGRYAAPTAQEIADQLPKGDTSEWGQAYPTSPVLWVQDGTCYAAYKSETTGEHNDDELWSVQAPTMAEALAALWLKLQEAK